MLVCFILGISLVFFYCSLEVVFDFYISFDAGSQYLVRGGGFCQWMYFLPFLCKFGQIVSLRKIAVSTHSLESLVFIHNSKLIFLILSLLSIFPPFICAEGWPGSKSLRAVQLAPITGTERSISVMHPPCDSSNEAWVQELQAGSLSHLSTRLFLLDSPTTQVQRCWGGGKGCVLWVSKW